MGRETSDDVRSSIELAFAELEPALSALWQWLGETFLLPGNLAVAFLTSNLPELAQRAGLDLATYRDIWAFGVSSVAWLLALVLGIRLLKTAGHTLAVGWSNVRDAFGRTWRSVRLGMAEPLAGWRRRRVSRRWVSQELRIDPLQMAALDALSKLPPGHVATAIDIAGDLGVRPGLLSGVLEELTRLQLVQVPFATSDGYPGYGLTRAGEVFLATCGARARREPTVSAAGAQVPIRVVRAGPPVIRQAPRLA